MTESAQKPARRVPSAAERQQQIDRQNADARKQFLDKYEGPILRIPIKLTTREVIRAYKRNYLISLRSWWNATNIPRIQLKSNEMSAKVEAGMLRKIEDTISFFTKQMEVGKLKASEANVDMNLLSHGLAFTDETPVIGPVGMKLRQLFLVADQFLSMSEALYAYQEIDGAEASSNKHTTKTKLEAVATSIRNFQRMALNAVNEAGKGRPGFNKVDVAAVDAALDASIPKPDDAGDNVVAIGRGSGDAGQQDDSGKAEPVASTA